METLIINKRHELPRNKRLAWDAVTVVLWLGFLYLWEPLLVVFYKIVTLNEPVDEISDWIFENISSVTFEHAIYMLIATPVVLFVLSRLGRHQAPSEHLIYSQEDYADYFHIDNARLSECANSQYVTVYHDDHGRILDVKSSI